MNKFKTLLLIFFMPFFVSAQIDVAETTLKVNMLSEENLYYGFAEGDQLVFNFEELTGKELKEIEIVELPGSSKFMDYKSTRLTNKTLNITSTGIYKFRLYNSSLGVRVCKMKIQRIPAWDVSKNFNTSVYWKTIQDTTYTTEQERYIVKTDTLIVNLTDMVAKVHSGTNANGNKTTCNFELPLNTIAWSYYIGVDQAGQQAYQSAARKLSSSFSSSLKNYSPMAAVALNAISYLPTLQAGEDVDYYIADPSNVNLFMAGQPFRCLKHSKVINDFSQMLSPVMGNYYICLANDNAIMPVSVTVKVTAITVQEKWGSRPVKRFNVTTHEEAYLKN